MKAVAKKTFNEIPTVNIKAFQEARTFIEKICTGHINPEIVQNLARKAQRLMESRKAQIHKWTKPASGLSLHGDATVIRRSSGLFVPPKYKDI